MQGPLSTSVGDLGAGYTLGRYEMIMPIARGGMAVVWAARLKGTRGFQKLVAIKTMRPEMVEDADFEQMFLDEASLASRIRHPHVVEILDLGEERGLLYLVMEWIDGESLHVLMSEAARKGSIPLPIAVRIATQICAGLHAAHELRDDAGNLVGLVHRDISPQNVLVTWDGVAKVVDFGVAKALGRGVGETAAGNVKGKTAYMAPEQARGGAVDRRTDLFAIGILLYSMTTGKHPFRRENDVATMLNICSDAPAIRPTKLIPGYPPTLERIVMQALEKDPSKRFPSASDMLKALDRALPSSMRVSADEDVAAFVRFLLGDRFEKRREQLKAGLKAADDRVGAVIALRQASEISSAALLPLPLADASSTDQSGTNLSSPAIEPWPATTASTSTTGAGAHPGVPADLTGRVSSRRSTSPLIVGAAAAVACVVSVILTTIAIRGPKPGSALLPAATLPPEPSALPAPTASTAPLPTAESSAMPAATTSSAEIDDADADASSPKAASTAVPKAGLSKIPGPVAGSAAPARPPASAPPTTLPQIRNPGF